MKKVFTVIGTRPQLVKASVVSRAIRECGSLSEVLVDTGQHYDRNMSGLFYEELGIPQPKYDLAVGSGRHGEQTGRMLARIEELCIAEGPDLVLVYGDTNSTLAGTLAASKLNILVAHVEAGLRSFNRRMPEEINRVVADHCADFLFAPTAHARTNLLAEGISNDKVFVVGDVMYDANRTYAARSLERSDVLNRLGLERNGFVLSTIHRAENTNDPRRLLGILDGLELVARETPVVLPLHPRTRSVMRELAGIDMRLSRLTVVDPVGYLDMLALQRGASVIATDSGGVQKEAFFAGRFCVTLREETEWVELLENGVNVLAGSDPDRIASCIREKLGHTFEPKAELYGDGTTAVRIVSQLESLASTDLRKGVGEVAPGADRTALL